jgi:hypothetical protein
LQNQQVECALQQLDAILVASFHRMFLSGKCLGCRQGTPYACSLSTAREKRS